MTSSTTPANSAPGSLQLIPTDILDAMTEQMKDVVRNQDQRAEACRRAGAEAAAQAQSRTPNATPGQLGLIAARAEYRAERAWWNEGGPTMTATLDLSIPAAGHDVPVRIHRPSDAPVLPAIVFLHGGGFTVGDLDTHDRIMRVLAAESGAAVVGVDYTLSPEVKFPQALLESAGVIAHLAKNGCEFGIDGSRLAVAGDSAGAALTMGSGLLLRDSPDRVGASAGVFDSIRALLPIYGGHGLRDSASMRTFGGSWDGMSVDELAGFREGYFPAPEDARHPTVSHIDADLSGLPPVFIAAAGLDPLCDDSRALARLLRRAGNGVEFHEYPGVLHSFLHFGRALDETNECLSAAAAFVAAAF